jgi:cyclin A
MKSPDFEYIDNGDSSMLASLQRRADEHLRISEDTDVEGLLRFILRSPFLSVFCQKKKIVDSVACGLLSFSENKWKKNAPAPMEIDRVCDVDNDLEDPQLCATLASDIYMHLREAEVTHSFLNPGAKMVCPQALNIRNFGLIAKSLH